MADEITAMIDADPHGPWPGKGTPVYGVTGKGPYAGNVKVVFLAMDAVCITVETVKGQVNVIREFGDTCTEVTA